MAAREPMSATWSRVASRWLPFADAASAEMPLARLLRLALFQVSVGMAAVLLNGTLNRVMIVELGLPAGLIAMLIALPLLIAPVRALIGHRSDTHRSVLGWRRVPYIWGGTMLMFGGLAIMPFALLLSSRPDTLPLGALASALAFLMTGTGMHVTQTAGLALAGDLVPAAKRPRAVALLYVMLLVGMMLNALIIGGLLADFRPTRLVEIVQGAALSALLLNILALWKQEPRGLAASLPQPVGSFTTLLRDLVSTPRTARLLVAIGIGSAAFAMQDALLEPYGGEVLGLSVGATTALTGMWAAGALAGFIAAGRLLSRGGDPLRAAGAGLVIGIFAFLLVLFAAPFASKALLYLGAVTIGLGLGLFAVGTLIEAMSLAGERHGSGLVVGAWGAVQASAAGLAIAIGGIARDIISAAATRGDLGSSLSSIGTGYGAVYVTEILLLLGALVVLGPIVGQRRPALLDPAKPMGLQEFPT